MPVELGTSSDPVRGNIQNRSISLMCFERLGNQHRICWKTPVYASPCAATLRQIEQRSVHGGWALVYNLLRLENEFSTETFQLPTGLLFMSFRALRPGLVPPSDVPYEFHPRAPCASMYCPSG